MFCKECGKQLSENSKFCTRCGTAVSANVRKNSAAENVSDKAAENVIANTDPADITAANSSAEQAATAVKAIEETSKPVKEDTAVTEEKAAEPVKEDTAVTEEKPAEPVKEDAAAAEEKAAEPVKEDAAVTEEKPAEPVKEDAVAAEEKTAEPVKEDTAAAEGKSAEPVKEDIAAAEEKPAEPVKEDTAVTEEKPAEPVKENAAVTEEKPAEPVKEDTAAAEEKAAEPVPVNNKRKNNKLPKEPKAPKAKKEKSAFSVKKIVIPAAAAVIVGVMGLWIMPEYLNSVIFNAAADKVSSPQTSVMMRVASGCDDKDILQTKLSLARSYEKREEYGAAAALFGKLSYNGIENADEDLDEVLEEDCTLLMEQSQTTYAIAMANLISDKDTSEKYKNTIYISAAKTALSENDTTKLERYINKVNLNYPYDQDSYNDVLYKYAVNKFDANEIQTAYDAFDKISSYSDSAEYLKKCSYKLGEELLKAKQYLPALKHFENADGYKDSVDKIKECNYRLGIYYYNSNDFEAAQVYFDKVKGYEDANTYLRKITSALKYDGWYIEAYTCNDIDDYYYYTTTSFSAYDNFILYIKLYNENDSSEYIDLDVTLTDSSGNSSTRTLYWMYNGSADYVSFNYEYPYFVTANSGKFTVTIKETGTVLGSYYYTID